PMSKASHGMHTCNLSSGEAEKGVSQGLSGQQSNCLSCPSSMGFPKLQALAVLELTTAEADVKLTEIHLPLPPECCIKGSDSISYVLSPQSPEVSVRCRRNSELPQ
ncbi:hypothetical protein H671_5g13938, partial [Cricetulus griseus]